MTNLRQYFGKVVTKLTVRVMTMFEESGLAGETLLLVISRKMCNNTPLNSLN